MYKKWTQSLDAPIALVYICRSQKENMVNSSIDWTKSSQY